MCCSCRGRLHRRNLFSRRSTGHCFRISRCFTALNPPFAGVAAQCPPNLTRWHYADVPPSVRLTLQHLQKSTVRHCHNSLSPRRSWISSQGHVGIGRLGIRNVRKGGPDLLIASFALRHKSGACFAIGRLAICFLRAGKELRRAAVFLPHDFYRQGQCGQKPESYCSHIGPPLPK